MTKGRIELIARYGYEVVVKCCREWKMHFANGNFGVCGICRERPILVRGKTWED